MKAEIICLFASVAVFSNTFHHEFVYDDRKAVLGNPSVIGTAPLWSVLTTDYWGVDLAHPGSHKSYRPLTTLTFRMDAQLSAPGRPTATASSDQNGNSAMMSSGHHPSASRFHVTNVLLHAAVTMLLVSVCRVWTGERLALLTGLTFAVHPVHCEAVASVVGRAELLSAVFFLLCLLVHSHTRVPTTAKALAVPMLAGASMLAKETGITVLVACALVDVVTYHQQKASAAAKHAVAGRESGADGQLLSSLKSHVLSCVCLLSLRWLALHGSLPSFSKADNPAAHADSAITRGLTFLFLPVVNFAIMLCPATLSFDWSMGSIPLVESLTDLRNVVTIGFYAILSLAVIKFMRPIVMESLDSLWSVLWRCKKYDPGNPIHVDQNGNFAVAGHHKASERPTTPENGDTRFLLDNRHLVSVGLCLMIVPFLPATNLLFYVGFVVAERVLYLPSIGFCLLLAISLDKWSSQFPRMFQLAIFWLVAVSACRTVARNSDWQTERALFSSSLQVNPAKAWANLGHALHSEGDIEAAELALRHALTIRSNMADTHYNLGVLLQTENRLKEAAQAYKAAIHFRPKLCVAYLNLGIVYNNLGLNSEAIKVLRNGTTVDDVGLKDPQSNLAARVSTQFQLGQILMQTGESLEANKVLHRAANLSQQVNNNHNIRAKIFNLLGESYQALGQPVSAEAWFSLSLATNPNHLAAHITLANILAKNSSRLAEAEQWYQRAVSLHPEDPAVHVHYGLFLLDSGRSVQAVGSFQAAVRLTAASPVYEYVFNLAVAARQAGRHDLAEANYRAAVGLRPHEAEPHTNLGAMLHLRGKLAEAETEYLAALKLSPGDATTLTNLERLRAAMRKKKRGQ